MNTSYSQKDIEKGYLKRRRLKPSSFFRLITSVDTPKLLNHLGLLKNHTTRNINGQKQYFICCPFHQEKTPSCSINQSKGYFYCWGCHAKGDLVQFVARVQQKGNIHAIRVIRELSQLKGLEYETVKSPIPEVMEEARNIIISIIDEWGRKQNDTTYYDEIQEFFGEDWWECDTSYLSDFLTHNKLQELYTISQYRGDANSDIRVKRYSLMREFFDYVDNRRQGESNDDFRDLSYGLDPEDILEV